MDRDRKITPELDLNFVPDPMTRTLAVQRYAAAGRLGGMQPVARSAVAFGFDAFPADGSRLLDGRRLVSQPHRVWEVAVDLGKIKVGPGETARLGMRFASPLTGVTIEPVRNFTADFSELIEVQLGNAGIQETLLGDPNAVIDLEPNFLELTQAVQTRDNSIPLVAGKKTVARVYPKISNTSSPQPVFTYLHGRRNGVELPGSPLFTFGYTPLAVQRSHLNHTPVFVLPDSWITGSVEFQVRIRGWAGTEKISSPLVRSFNPRGVPTIWIVPINTGTAASPVLASDWNIAAHTTLVIAL